MTSRLSSTPISVVPTPSELENGVLSQRNLEIAVRALSRDGLVVLEDMVDHAVLDRLNAKMVKDAYELQARNDSPFNYNKGNIQQDPPMTKEWFSEAIYTSKLMTSTPSLRPSTETPLICLRSHCYPSHLDRPRPKAVIAVCVWQYRTSAN
jgi:hypothetical protein